MSKNTLKAKTYTLRDSSGRWLGQVVITNDGMLGSVTDYGNFSYAWRSFGDNDFREFLISLNVHYFASKMYQGMAYIIVNKKIEKSCLQYAEHILPALQEAIRNDQTEW